MISILVSHMEVGHLYREQQLQNNVVEVVSSQSYPLGYGISSDTHIFNSNVFFGLKWYKFNR